MSAATTSSRFARFLRAGPIMMGLGGLLLVGGIVGTTASTNGGNQSCPTGTTLIAKFDYDHGYSFSSPSGNEHVVTLSHADADGATWHSTKAISYVIVKGGTDSVLFTIAPPKTDGTFSNSGLPDVGHSHNPPDISNVQFCGVVNSSTSTTSSSTTSSSTSTSTSTSTTLAHSTTTTCQCQTPTTAAPTTSTTCQCQTTTTHAPTTTTCECQTTTTHHVPTTTCSCETTTTHHVTTTTAPEGTTIGASTTTASSTTSSTVVSGSTIVVGTTTTVRTHHVTTTTRVSAGGQGGTTTFKPYVTVTSILTPDGGNTLPFTGSSSTPLIALGIVLLATGLTITLSQARRRERSGT